MPGERVIGDTGAHSQRAADLTLRRHRKGCWARLQGSYVNVLDSVLLPVKLDNATPVTAVQMVTACHSASIADALRGNPSLSTVAGMVASGDVSAALAKCVATFTHVRCWGPADVDAHAHRLAGRPRSLNSSRSCLESPSWLPRTPPLQRCRRCQRPPAL